jgi:putative ABC transport system permease protein
MTRGLLKNTFRSIRDSFGRYVSILLIVLLGVGFYAGLSITELVMTDSVERYFSDNKLYDVELVSGYGFSKDDVGAIASAKYVKNARGYYSADVLAGVMTSDTDSATASDKAYHIMSYTRDINEPYIIAGRMPEKSDECIVDSKAFTRDDIGKKIKIQDDSPETSIKALKNRTLTITGIAKSPLYISKLRGSTEVGNGDISGFIICPEKNFTGSRYYGCYVDLNTKGRIYSDEYKKQVNVRKKPAIEAVSETEITSFDRSTNVGYKSFENDVTIVSAIAKVFPAFFFLVAALVSASTMSRMMEEERLHMGVLLSMGYRRSSILMKYFIYSGSAGVLGWFIGIEIGRRIIPYAVWQGYGSVYEFPDKVVFSVDIGLFLFCLVISILVTAGVTVFFGRRELKNTPAELIRPRAPKAGKKILLEKISYIWKRLGFLHKVSFRNLFRYKVRSAMMIIGIAGCTALMVAGFGIRRAFPLLSELQYDDDGVYRYDAEANFSVEYPASGNEASKLFEKMVKTTDNEISKIAFMSSHLGTVVKSKADEELIIRSVLPDGMYGATDTGELNIHQFIDFISSDGKKLNLPEKGEILIDMGYSVKNHVKVGDTIKIYGKDADKTTKLKVSGIYKNYLGNGLFINAKDVSGIFGNDNINAAYLLYSGQKNEDSVTAKILSLDEVASLSEKNNLRDQFNSSMNAINLIIVVVIIAAGMLAFVVIYNLTNINLTERRREIATIQVLGFRDNELLTYVFRENNILSGLGALLGLILGKLLFDFILDNISTASIVMVKNISPVSFIAAFFLTMFFSFMMRIFMRKKVCDIDMADALKSVE